MITQKVCGGIIYKKTDRGIRYLILKRARYHNGVKWIEGSWTFPKVLKKDMQSDEAITQEQIRRETGMNVEFKGKFYEDRPYIFYWSGKRIKRENHFLLFNANNGATPKMGDGIADYYWADLSEVKKRMSLPSSTKVFEQAENVISVLGAQSLTQPSAEEKNTA